MPSQLREDFLRQFPVIELDDEVAREAIALRQKYKLKLPDAITGKPGDPRYPLKQEPPAPPP